MKKLNKKILKIIYWFLIVFIIFIALISTLSTLNVELPFRLYSVKSGSMKPTIKVGDLIFVKEQEEYKVNDVIAFESGSGKSLVTVTHRIVGINEDNTFKTKGDFNNVSDVASVDKEEIVGKYVFRIPLLGYPINFVKTPIGFLLVILIPSVIISYEEAKKIKNIIVSKRRDRNTIKEISWNKKYQK
ncbi:MAG: signal peptidase I, signal peptidase, endoplasmic reticulum-type [candidate division WS6 bacterium GW2011_GWC1_33_20]|uniref:Signal peptidase I n=2 Tax=Candidatus Dojkabacteria TaxID=74243 RepID=A0A0G0AE57_9BACT|nr:MAG: signal peptidase I, signal peptidase, endoplasmic reticulum-type [candidate division WS6 bacterium GW2011_GWE2_33_157]KKP44179.1 MAG: signal peptidase I, signal peptidase, endoplasmic reticulum-type [candidate division WS6 bacterium GW2011_GWC1_33_20]KKP45764.1 MAG: signal peptidase I, signal peptidase, endoplasmic reticulum-type [candidate division WS6 bacterium GW2011_GWF1_33_233]KKP55074.1 MAG: Signal peptidase I [candidate division WS6 bacterium GW2011_GWB1_33_6]KKP55207.1 MAG: sign